MSAYWNSLFVSGNSLWDLLLMVNGQIKQEGFGAKHRARNSVKESDVMVGGTRSLCHVKQGLTTSADVYRVETSHKNKRNSCI